MKTFRFVLGMPNVGSCNGKWTGSGKNYVIFRTLKNAECENIEEKTYRYDFGDGWSASVTVTKTDAATKRKNQKKSDGFAGYDWMVDSIIKHGEIIA